MTPQQVFDHIVSHLRGMESRAGFQTTDCFQCSYLDDKNRMCAVGSLFPLLNLPNEVLTEMQMFQGDAIDLLKDFNSYLPEWFILNDRLLRHLQNVHDEGKHWDEYGFNRYGENCLKIAAIHHDLVYTPK